MVLLRRSQLKIVGEHPQPNCGVFRALVRMTNARIDTQRHSVKLSFHQRSHRRDVSNEQTVWR